jgi:hypothetical protein
MASQLKWALLALGAMIVLGVMTMIGGATGAPDDKDKPAAAAPAK